MKNNFRGLIWSSFWGIQSLVLGFLGFVASLLAWAFAGQTPIPLVVVFVIITIALLVIATLIRALQTVKQNIIPKILRVQKDANNNLQCLLESSDLFAAQSIISLYYTDEDDFERFIGVGFVESINNKGRIQVVIDRPEITYQNILDKLANNDLKVIQQTRVSPSAPKKYNQP